MSVYSGYDFLFAEKVAKALNVIPVGLRYLWPRVGRVAAPERGRKVRTSKSAVPGASRDGVTRWKVPQKLHRPQG